MSSRLHYLDALRSFCMLYGIFVHTGTLDSTAELSKLVFASSDHFRMATFFLISGFFAVMVLNKRGVAGFYRHRATALLVPLAAGLVLLNPVTNWLVQKYQMPELGLMAFLTGDHGPLPAPVNWHLHLWFLFSLATYVALLPLIRPLLRALTGAADWLAARPRDLVIVVLALVAVLGEMAGRMVYGALFEPFVDGTQVAWLFRGTLQYTPYFVLGALTFLSRPLFEALHRISIPAIVIALALQGALMALPAGPSGLKTLVEVVAEEFMTLTVAATLFALFRRFLSGESRIVTALNDAVYTIYLFHFLIIYTLADFVFPGLAPFWLLFAVVSVATFVIGFALHHYVISRVPLLSLLFNGKYKLSGPRALARGA